MALVTIARSSLITRAVTVGALAVRAMTVGALVALGRGSLVAGALAIGVVVGLPINPGVVLASCSSLTGRLGLVPCGPAVSSTWEGNS